MTSDVATAIVNHILDNIFDKIDMSVNDQTIVQRLRNEIAALLIH